MRTAISVFGALLLAAMWAGSAETKIRKREIRYIAAADGHAMFQAYCASCHGPDGKGHGPAAGALKMLPADLTILSSQNNGEFPAIRVMNILGNLPGSTAHGSSEMPLWGDVFRLSGDASSIVQTRIYNLTQFVQAIQEPSVRVAKTKVSKPEPLQARDITPTSGAEMYKAYCSSCHGADGRGFGPMAGTLTRALPDLTVLTRTHNGKYPDTHIMEVLGLRAGNVTAHGSTQMPIWGDVFRAGHEGPDRVQLRVTNLVNYIKTLQQ